jgi:hypothetical protein
MSDIESEEIKSIIEMKDEMEKGHEAVPFDPILAVEESLFSFLDFRLKKLRSDMEFQDQIKDCIKARLPEADFNDLRILLQQEQNNTNTSTQGVLTPFIPRVQEIDKTKIKTKQVEETLFEESAKDNLQAFNELFQMFGEMKKNMNLKKETAESNVVKKALEESMKEDTQ